MLCWIWTFGCRIEGAEGYTELWHPLIQVTIIIAETGHRWRGVQDPLLRLICRWNKSHHLAPPSSICDEVDSCSTISALQIGLQQHITLKYVCRQSLIWKLSIGGMLWGVFDKQLSGLSNHLRGIVSKGYLKIWNKTTQLRTYNCHFKIGNFEI